MAIGKALGGALTLLGYEVMYSREGDIETDDLGFRAQLANDNGVDAFVSIHCNSAESTAAKGVEVYHYPGSDAGTQLATGIQRMLAVSTPLKDCGVKEDNFAVLRLTTMPAVLVECGFLSSEEDRNFLIDDKQQTAIAFGIAAGINRYFIA
jgi:N-acetylmuramoyl-L-alanine amidase